MMLYSVTSQTLLLVRETIVYYINYAYVSEVSPGWLTFLYHQYLPVFICSFFPLMLTLFSRDAEIMREKQKKAQGK